MGKVGGRRPGAGRPKGFKFPATISKERARAAIAAAILKHADELVAAQISNAKGLRYLVVRDKKTGKFLRVGELQAREIDESVEAVEIWEKDPSIQAFTDLMNRAIDKPKEQEQEIAVRGSVDVVGILKARASRRKLENP